MVLLAAAICTKAGKALISRQFVEMTKARIEGLLAAFPKLMNTGKQHTFVETESVRYVYQPMEKLYMLLITTKASNILEDLETLRLFSRVIPEFCRAMEESEINDHAFELIFAFDEIVALGYRENVNLAQIRTFTEMDSHEERVALAIRQTQEKEAKDEMKKRAKEMDRQRRDALKRGMKSPSGFGGGIGGGIGSGPMPSPVIGDTLSSPVDSKPLYVPPSRPSGPSKALKLGSKTKDIDSFVDQLKQEGQDVVTNSRSAGNKPLAVNKASTPSIATESVHVRIEEKILLNAGRDGGVQNMEILGLITLRVSDEQFGRIKLQLTNNDTKGVQLQTHPNVDKKLFGTSSLIALKNPAKPFPVNSDVGVLKWRYQSTDEGSIPLSINCWPSESGSGCDVNIEYELEDSELELNDVCISIPLPQGAGSPTVNECEGQYRHDRAKNQLEWQIPVIDSANKSASMDFSINGGHPDDFFPVTVSFVSKKSYCDIKLDTVEMYDDGAPVKFSSDTIFFTEKYEIV